MAMHAVPRACLPDLCGMLMMTGTKNPRAILRRKGGQAGECPRLTGHSFGMNLHHRLVTCQQSVALRAEMAPIGQSAVFEMGHTRVTSALRTLQGRVQTQIGAR